jgi:hypothetical protein
VLILFLKTFIDQKCKTTLISADDNAMMGMSSSSSGIKTSGFVSKDSKPPSDNVERRANALSVLKLICESQVFMPHLEALLAMQDAQVKHVSSFC